LTSLLILLGAAQFIFLLRFGEFILAAFSENAPFLCFLL
jgi:hypothetical protein